MKDKVALSTEQGCSSLKILPSDYPSVISLGKKPAQYYFATHVQFHA